MVLVFTLAHLMVRKIKVRRDNLGKIYCILGASGTGKTTLTRDLDIPEIVSHTTRNKRDGEEEGKTYYYVSEDEFEKLNFIERVEYSGNKYGLAKSEIKNKLNKSNKVFVIIDKEGIKQLKEVLDEKIVVIYVKATLKEIMNRLKERDGLDGARKRIRNAIKDEEFGNDDIADYIINNNKGKFEKSKEKLQKIIDK